MIDEKKIEEAAEKAAITHGEGRFIDLDFSEGFKAGINWFLDNLKRPMNESPKMGDLVLIVRNMEQYELRHGNKNVDLAFTHELDFHDNWKDTYAKNPEYKYWVNVDEIIDLLKGGK